MSTLPDSYKDEWFVRSCVDSVSPGMALYDNEEDTFYHVFDTSKHSVELHTLDQNHGHKMGIDELETQLHERYIPCEVKAEPFK